MYLPCRIAGNSLKCVRTGQIYIRGYGVVKDKAYGVECEKSGINVYLLHLDASADSAAPHLSTQMGRHGG